MNGRWTGMGLIQVTPVRLSQIRQGPAAAPIAWVVVARGPTLRTSTHAYRSATTTHRLFATTSSASAARTWRSMRRRPSVARRTRGAKGPATSTWASTGRVPAVSGCPAAPAWAPIAQTATRVSRIARWRTRFVLAEYVLRCESGARPGQHLSLIHISEPTRPY